MKSWLVVLLAMAVGVAWDLGVRYTGASRGDQWWTAIGLCLVIFVLLMLKISRSNKGGISR